MPKKNKKRKKKRRVFNKNWTFDEERDRHRLVFCMVHTPKK